MCILIACKPGATVPEMHLLESVISNPDGAGWAIHCGEAGIVSTRSLSGKGAVESFLAARKTFPSGPAIFHARIASVGDVTLDNTHPFYVGKHSDIVVAHNGFCLDLGDDMPASKSGISDTRAFAETFMPGIGVESLDEDRAAWESWAGSNKLAFLSANRLLASELYIIGEDGGHWQNGVWYSNRSYIPWTYAAKPMHTVIKTYDPETKRWTYSRGIEAEVPALGTGDNSKANDYDAYAFDNGDCFVCRYPLTEDDFMDGTCSECYTCLECESFPCHCETEPDADLGDWDLLDPFQDSETFHRAVERLSAP